MSKATRLGWGAASLLVILLVVAIACEDSPVVAPSDGSITVTLNPTTVTIDATNQQKSSEVRAILLDKDGKPVSNANVYFSSSGGRIVKPGSNPEVALDTAVTDSSGIARATLVVTATDPDEVDVTALSGALTDTATLSKGVVGQQRPPTANFTIDPCGTPCSAAINQTVTFQSTSTDPNPGDVLTYLWIIESSATTTPDKNGPTQSNRFSRRYSEAQELHVTLHVSDDPAAMALPNPNGTEAVWDDATTKDYRICNNHAPVAVAAVTVNGRSVSVDGSGSSDPDTGDTLSYSWQCGNGTTVTGVTAVCNYVAAGNFTITLTVTDAPTGCAAKSDTDSKPVTIQ